MTKNPLLNAEQKIVSKPSLSAVYYNITQCLNPSEDAASDSTLRDYKFSPHGLTGKSHSNPDQFEVQIRQ